MLQISVPENDQSVYELTTKSSKTFLVRCPGSNVESETDALFCFVVEGDAETLTMFSDTDEIATFVKRPDVNVPAKALHPSRVLDLMSHHPDEGAHGFRLHRLA